uniref:RNA polymerase alpha subunit C-terminal domain-containing protein n=1 Tax=Tolypothrix bouteillei VB521301 TaxID=1479485 RepID=A0A0C1NIL4_9CYAN
MMNPNSQPLNPLLSLQHPTAKASVDENEPCTEQSSGGGKKPPLPPGISGVGDSGFSWSGWEEVVDKEAPIEVLLLSIRTYNLLKRRQINTIAQLFELGSPENILQIKGMKVDMLEEIVSALNQLFD